MNQYYAHGRDMLADLIESIPMDEPSEIIIVTVKNPTVYRFPAVMNADGSDLRELGLTPAEHIEYQTKRRTRIAKAVRRSAQKNFL